MAQSALTTTPPNPTPPTNLVSNYINTALAGSTRPPNVAYSDAVYGVIDATPGGPASGDPWHPGITTLNGVSTGNSAPPFADDGTATTPLAFGAPASGTASEGAGTEVVVTQTYAAGVLVPGSAATYQPTGQTPAWAEGAAGGPVRMFSCLGNFTGVANSPNASHASSLSPQTALTVSAVSPNNIASGVGQQALTVTGTGFTSQSKIFVNGVEQTTTFTSSTSLLAPAVTKRTSAGTWPVTVTTAGAVTAPTAATWTFT